MISKFLSLILIIFVIALLLLFTKDLWLNLVSTSPTEIAIEQKLKKQNLHWKNLQFDLVDPEEAPEGIKKLVMEGFQLLLHTHEKLPKYVGDRLDCTNCHFNAGLTTGGVGGGISLAGVAAQYPKINERTKEVEDLAMRVNSCFKNSMNGSPLPKDSPAMLAIITYLQWISSKYPIYVKAPWLGLKPLKTKAEPNSEKGKELYIQLCADCHGSEGQGGNESENHPGLAIPPLWGKESFNTSAGMNQLSTFSSFIFNNMPYENPHLTPEQAIDIASYVLSQPRENRKH